MSFDVIKEQVDLLQDGERRRLLAYLVSLEDAKTAGYASKLQEKIKDNAPGRWLTIDELDKRLGLSDTDS